MDNNDVIDLTMDEEEKPTSNTTKPSSAKKRKVRIYLDADLTPMAPRSGPDPRATAINERWWNHYRANGNVYWVNHHRNAPRDSEQTVMSDYERTLAKEKRERKKMEREHEPSPTTIISLVNEDDHLLVFPEGCSRDCTCNRCKNVRFRLDRKEQDNALKKALEMDRQREEEELREKKKRKREREVNEKYLKEIKPDIRTERDRLRELRLRGLKRYKQTIRKKEEASGKRNLYHRRRFNRMALLRGGSSTGNVREIILFHATWCAPCKELKPVFDAFSSTLPPTVLVRKYDIDDAETKEIVQTRGVRGVPTIMYVNGETIKTLTGVQSPERLREVLLEVFPDIEE